MIGVIEIVSSSRPLPSPGVWPHRPQHYARVIFISCKRLPVYLEVQRSLPLVFQGAGWQVQRWFPDICIPLDKVLLWQSSTIHLYSIVERAGAREASQVRSALMDLASLLITHECSPGGGRICASPAVYGSC